MEFIVRIRVQNVAYGGVKVATGTGVLLKNRTILTNYHVIGKRLLQCELFHPHTQKMLTFKRIVRYSVWFDLTLIEIGEDLPFVELDDKMPPLGSDVVSLGFAEGSNRTPFTSKTNLSRYDAFAVSPLFASTPKVLIGGMSGGPLLYCDKLIGLNSSGNEDMSFYVPIFNIKLFMDTKSETIEVDENIFSSRKFYVDSSSKIHGEVKIPYKMVNGCLNLKDLGFTSDDVFISIMFILEHLDIEELHPVNYFYDDEYRVIGEYVIKSQHPTKSSLYFGYPRIFISASPRPDLENKYITSHYRVRDIEKSFTISVQYLDYHIDV